MIVIKNSTYEISNQLTKVDLMLLERIYLLRCLTIRQAYREYYINEISSFEEFENTKLKELLDFGIVKSVDFKGNNTALFLTSSGVEIVRYMCDLPCNIIDEKRNVIKRGYYRASELEILPRLINHQIHLNQFVINFEKYALEKKIKWKYYDEKYVSQYASIRPDGLIQLLDVDLFLEMDMNTESKKQLLDKWQNYRNFLTSREFSFKEKKIVVLFIIDGTNNVEKRKDLIRHTIANNILDLVTGDFDIYIGTPEELLKLIFDELIPNVQQSNWRKELISNSLFSNFNFSVANGDKLKKVLNNSEYGYYIRKIDSQNNLIIENGKIQEYLFDDYFYRPISVLNKIAYLQRNTSIFKERYNRDISYVILVDDIDIAYQDLKVSDLIGVKNVYFTTLDRINNYPISSAFFQYDSLGNVHHFTDNSLNNRIFEKSLE